MTCERENGSSRGQRGALRRAQGAKGENAAEGAEGENAAEGAEGEKAERTAARPPWLWPLLGNVAFVVIWASGYLVGDLGTRAAPPFTLLVWRFLTATVIMVVVALVTRAPWPRSARLWLRLAVVGILLQTVQFGGVYLGLRLGVPAGLTSLLVCTSPLLITVASWPLFGERINRLQGLGLLLGLAGVLAAVGAELTGSVTVAGVIAVLVGLSGFVAGTLLQKGFGAAINLRTGVSIQFLAAAVTVVPLASAFGGVELPLNTQAIGSTLWLGTVNSIGGFLLLFVLLRSRSGGGATSTLFLVPAATALAGVPILGEPVSVGAFAGIALAGVGVWLVSRRPRVDRRRRAGGQV